MGATEQVCYATEQVCYTDVARPFLALVRVDNARLPRTRPGPFTRGVREKGWISVVHACVEFYYRGWQRGILALFLMLSTSPRGFQECF